MTLTDAIGLIAPVLFIWAYIMVALGHWNARLVRFHVLNLAGALLIMLSLLEHWNLAVFVLECSWSLISVYGIIQARMKQKTKLPV